jgi:hypothetical protein
MKVEIGLYGAEEKELFAEFLLRLVELEREFLNADSADYTESSPEKDESVAPEPVAEEAPVKKERKPRAKKEVKVEEPVATPEEVKAQDEADEAEESAAAKPADKPLTHDDARSAFAPYIKKYGMTAAQADASSLLQSLFGAEVKAVKDIPDNQEALSKAIAAAVEMLETNPHGREAV